MRDLSLLIITLTLSLKAFTQVAIGTNAPDASAALDVTSTTQGFLPPRMVKAQIKAIKNPEEGLMVYCLDCNPKAVYVHTGYDFENMTTGESIFYDVKSKTGRVWMDRNLGAKRVAISSIDEPAYGDYYQWGRNSDGHEKGDSSVKAGPVAASYTGDRFVLSGEDWLSPSDNARWNLNTENDPIKNEANDPCPIGYRIPTQVEWENEISSWLKKDSKGAFSSPLKLPLAGGRHHFESVIKDLNDTGRFYSSRAKGVFVSYLRFGNNYAHMNSKGKVRGYGFSIRCIRQK